MLDADNFHGLKRDYFQEDKISCPHIITYVLIKINLKHNAQWKLGRVGRKEEIPGAVRI